MSESDSSWLVNKIIISSQDFCSKTPISQDTAIDGLTQFERNVTTLLDALNSESTGRQAGRSLDADITALEASSSALCGSLGKLLEVVIPRISEGEI